MKATSEFDLMIVGAGIIGLSAALLFARNGFKVAIVEKRASLPLLQEGNPQAFEPKVVALTRASENLFRHLNVWQNIAQRSCAYQRMIVWDKIMDGQIHFDAMDFFEPNLGHIVENRVIEQALLQALQQWNVRWFLGTSVEQYEQQVSRIDCTLSSQQKLTAKVIVAADGARSALKALCQIESKEWDYKQHAIVGTIKSQMPHGSTAYQRFAENGPIALLPLADPHYSSFVWSIDTKQLNTLNALSAEQFTQQLANEMSNVLGELTLASEKVTVPLRAHHAKKYVLERIALIGDAAHTVHPLAGQGANLGLLDVAQLGQVLLAVKEKGRDIGALAVLKRYERPRRFHNQWMIRAMGAFKCGFASDVAMVQNLRNIGLNQVDKMTWLKHQLVKFALGQKGMIPSYLVSSSNE